MSDKRIINSCMIQPDTVSVPAGPWKSLGTYVDRPLGLGVVVGTIRVRVSCEIKTSGEGAKLRTTEDNTSLGNFATLPDTSGAWEIFIDQYDPDPDVKVGDHKYEIDGRLLGDATSLEVRNIQLLFVEKS